MGFVYVFRLTDASYLNILKLRVINHAFHPKVSARTIIVCIILPNFNAGDDVVVTFEEVI